MRSTLKLLTLTSAITAASIAQAQPPEKAPTKAIDTSTLSEFPQLKSIVTVRLGDIPVPVYPQNPDPDAPFKAAGPWFYPTPVKLVKADRPLFDKEAKTITVAFEQPPETAIVEDMAGMKGEIVKAYQRRETVNREITAELVNVQPIPLTGYEVTIEVKGKRIVIAKREPSEAAIVFVGKRTFDSGSITDPEVIAALEKVDPSTVTVNFRGFYGMQQVAVTKVSISAVQQALSKVHESVRGVPGDFNLVSLVTRDARLEAKKLVQTEFKTIIDRSATDDPDLVANLVNLDMSISDRYFAQLKPLTADEIDRATEAFVIWTADTARLEIQPAEFRKLTKALETKESFEKEWETAYSLLQKAMSERDGYEKTYNRLRNAFSSHSSANGSLAGILSAGGEFSLSNEFDKLSTEERRQFEKLYNEFQSGSLDKGRLRNSAYKKFAGEDWETSTKPKPLTIYRVSTRSFGTEVTSGAVDIRRTGSVNMPRNYEYSASGASEGWLDTYSRIEKALALTNKSLNKAIDDVDKRIKAEVKALSDSALKVTYFEVTIEKRGGNRPGIIQISDGDDMTEYWHPGRFGTKVIAVIPVVTVHTRAVDSIRSLEPIWKDNQAGIKSNYWKEKPNLHAGVRVYVIYQ